MDLDQGPSIVEMENLGEKGVSVVGGFLLEESKSSYSDQRPQFIPEEYGKLQTSGLKQEGTFEEAEYKICESCGVRKLVEQMVTPSRRFCSVTCCKRYSAARRYPSRKTKASKEQQTLRQKMAAYTPPTASGPMNSSSAGLLISAPESLSPSTPVMPLKGKRKKLSQVSNSSVTPPAKKKTANQADGTYSHPNGIPLRSWSVEEVSIFLKDLGFEAYQEKFQDHLIDGRVLMLISEDHMIKHLGVMLGPALKIQAQIDAMKNAENSY